MVPAPAPAAQVFYYFKSSRKLTLADIEAAAAKIDPQSTPKRPLPNIAFKEIQGRHWAVVLFRENASTAHNGRTCVLDDATQVELSVDHAEPHVYRSLKCAEPINEVLDKLKTIPSADVAKLHAQINQLLNDGVIGVGERAALEKHIKEKYGKSLEENFLLSFVPRLSLEGLDFLSQLSDDEKQQAVEEVVLSLISVGISISNIVTSIMGTMRAKAKFQNEVLIFIEPILEMLETLRSYTEDTASLLRDYIKEPKVALMNSVIISADNVVDILQKILNKIPVIENKILKYSEEREKEYEENRKQAIVSLILALPNLIQFADGMHTLAQKGMEALTNLEKIELAGDATRLLGYTAEFGVSVYAAHNHKELFNLAKKHLEFYKTVRQTLDEAKAKKLYQDLQDALKAANNTALLNDIATKYEHQGLAIKGLIKQGEEFQKSSKKVRK